MSKSLGNALDPLDLIAEYGTDALRFTLLTGGTPGNDLKLSVSRVEANRNFANKIWNAARFVIMKLQDAGVEVDTVDPNSPTYLLPDDGALSLPDRWILSRCESVRRETTRLIDNWQLGEAGRQLYEFLWNEYCDWYIEAAKVRLNEGTPAEAQTTRQVLAHVLERSLRLLHPFMPFVTEAIWQNLPGVARGEGRGADENEKQSIVNSQLSIVNEVEGEGRGARGEAVSRSLMVTRWPQDHGRQNADAEASFERVQEIVRAIRNVRSEYDVPAGKRIPAEISAGDFAPVAAENLAVMSFLARLDPGAVRVAADLPAPDKAAALAVGGVTVYLPLAGLIDLDAERKRIQDEIDNVDKQLRRSEGLLDNPGFTAKAPPAVIDRERAKQVELQEKRGQLSARLTELG